MTPEQRLQRDVTELYHAVGCTVHSLAQGYRQEPGGTRQTPGLPDLYVQHIGKGLTWWHEVKTPKGLAQHHRMLTITTPTSGQLKSWRRAHAQEQFRAREAACGRVYPFGGLDDAKAHLHAIGLLR